MLRQHPLVAAAALALLALKRPRRILGLTSRLLWGWGLYQRGVSGWIARPIDNPEPAQRKQPTFSDFQCKAIGSPCGLKGMNWPRVPALIAATMRCRRGVGVLAAGAQPSPA